MMVAQPHVIVSVSLSLSLFRSLALHQIFVEYAEQSMRLLHGSIVISPSSLHWDCYVVPLCVSSFLGTYYGDGLVVSS